MIKLDSCPKKIPHNKILLQCEYCEQWWLISEREMDSVNNKRLWPKCDCKYGHNADLIIVGEMSE